MICEKVFRFINNGEMFLIEEPTSICVYHHDTFLENINSFFSIKNNRDVIKLYELLDKDGFIKFFDVNSVVLKIAEIKFIISKESEIEIYTFDKVLYNGVLLWLDDFYFEDKYSIL